MSPRVPPFKRWVARISLAPMLHGSVAVDADIPILPTVVKRSKLTSELSEAFNADGPETCRPISSTVGASRSG